MKVVKWHLKGARAASADTDGTVIVWGDVDKGRKLRTHLRGATGVSSSGRSAARS